MNFQEEQGRIFLNDEEGKLIAEALFPGEVEWHFNRTFVDESLRGQGVAGKLVDAVVEKARKEGAKIIPECSYAVKAFEKNESYHDVLAKKGVNMRRKDLQISEAEALEVIDQSGYGVLATVNADGSPYVVPVSPARNGKVLYFHCAKAGQKIENIQRDARVCLSFVSYFRNDALLYTTKYQSAVVTGHAELVEDEEEKIHGLRLISEKYAMEHIDLFDEMIRKSARATSVYKITIDEITGKANHES